ncbi:MAG: creatininase family protein [Candidatus Thermoplasmatota archaeon]
MILDELTMKEFKLKLNKDSIAIVPFGIIEEHGEHLPLSTDSLQVEYVVEKVAEKIPNTFLLPCIRYGVCVSTRNFQGSISLSFDTMRSLAYDIFSELYRNGFRKIAAISGHAGRTHIQALRQAAERLVEEKKIKILVLSDYDLLYDKNGRELLSKLGIPEWDEHGGAIETSRILSIRKELVKAERTVSKPKIPKYLVFSGIEKKFPKGIIGNPKLATPAIGIKINEYVVNEIVKLIEAMK